ncbi:DUF423 domain-containing protein [Pararhizobium sp.]|uniref:DUF423 domain-containing protein n=1 Tax=Pararhizobium sp. TaxID=1977563 RepID=UPI00271C186C|nr:DUF423 domain-containing protein [Pararhizobium sp.]MDO9414961.1 DUF423 domain-containing protein [Pararhizobium sp.]
MHGNRRKSALILAAGLMGLAGVALAAAASHGDPRLLGGASAMCLAHAPALIALYAAYDRFATAGLAALLLGLGTALFAGDLLARQYLGHGLFPMSAPAGGMLMIAGWLAVAAGAFFKRPAAG